MKPAYPKIGRLLLLLLLAASLLSGTVSAAADDGGEVQGIVSYCSLTDDEFGSYKRVTVWGLTPYVFMPTGAGSENPDDFLTVTGMTERYGGEYAIVAAINAGIFYNAGTPTQYGFHFREADGVVIADGVVLKSCESIDHSECDILVIDEDGAPGWTDYSADADALAAGDGYYYDVNGDLVTGKKIVSAVTGFVPIVVGGENVYDPADALLHGYDNYVAHYTAAAPRQVFGVRDDGAYVLLSSVTGWTLDTAAHAAVTEDCVFAYALDGGGSAETVLGHTDSGGYTARTVRSQFRGERPLPTFLVFTADNKAPVSAVPVSIEAELPGTFPVGVTAAEIAAAATVTEYLENADGNLSCRALYSVEARPGVTEITHTVIGGEDISRAEVKSERTGPAGTLVYTKTAEDTALSLRNNGNTRADGRYYDHSAGFTVSVDGDLTTAGDKTVTFSYLPGGGYDPLTAQARITLVN